MNLCNQVRSFPITIWYLTFPVEPQCACYVHVFRDDDLRYEFMQPSKKLSYNHLVFDFSSHTLIIKKDAWPPKQPTSGLNSGECCSYKSVIKVNDVRYITFVYK